MKLAHYVIGIAAAAVAGTLAGRALFPKAAGDPAPPEPAPSSTAALTALANAKRSEAAAEAQAALQRLLAVRTSTSPGRTELEATLMLRRLDDAALLALVDRIVEGDVPFTNYEMPFLFAAWTRYAEIDPRAAFAAGLKLKTRLQCENTAGAAAQVWSEVDPEEALDFFLAGDLPWHLKHHSNTALRALAKTDLQAALQRLEANRDADWYSTARSVVYEAWKLEQPDAARRWLIEEAGDDPAASRDLILTFSNSDPAEAMAFALAMEPTAALRDAVGEVIAGRWMWRDQEAALAAFKTLPPEWHSPQSVENFGINGVQKLDAEQVLEVAAAIPEGELRNRFWFGVLARESAEAKFAQAVQTLAQIPEGAQRADGAGMLAGAWTTTNPAAASEWISTLEPGATRDQAISRFAEKLLPADPESALRWAGTIGDEDLRTRKLQNLRSQLEKFAPPEPDGGS